jgi:hypothetical protein
MYILTDPYNGNVVAAKDSLEAITKTALKMHDKRHDHPAFLCWNVREGRNPKCIGRLWREFGCDFNRANPWKKC